MSARSEVPDYLDEHGDPCPDGTDIDTARALKDKLGYDVQVETAAEYVGKWYDGDLGQTHAEDTANDGGREVSKPEPSTPDRDGVDDWSEVDSSELQRVKSSNPDCYAAWMDWPRRQYIFDLPASTRDGLDDIPFSEVQAMIEKYVHAGAGWTQDEVATYCNNKLGRDMTRAYFRDMLKALDITKTGSMFAPHRLRSQDPDELAQEQREKVEAAVEAEYKRESARKWRKKYEAQKEETLQLESFIDGLIDRVDCSAPVIDGDIPSRDDIARQMPARSDAILASDWHVGKEINVHGNRFDVGVAERRVIRSTERLIQHYRMDRRPLDEVVVCYLGDIIDGPHGDMHPGQWIGQDLTHLEQLEVASALMARQLTMLGEYFDDTPIRVCCVGGNHGRGRKGRDEDPKRLPEMAMYALAREKVPGDTIDEFHIHQEKRATMRTQIGGVHTVLTHGDRAPRDLADLGDVPHADQTLVLAGHCHEYEMRQQLDGDTTVLQNGCLCGITSFERDQCGKHVRPTQATVEVGPHGPQPGKIIHCQTKRSA